MIPNEFRFEKLKATPGCILAGKLTAELLNLPVQTVHFIAHQPVLNQDDMAISCNFLGDGSYKGKSGETETALVTSEAANHTSSST